MAGKREPVNDRSVGQFPVISSADGKRDGIVSASSSGRDVGGPGQQASAIRPLQCEIADRGRALSIPTDIKSQFADAAGRNGNSHATGYAVVPDVQ